MLRFRREELRPHGYDDGSVGGFWGGDRPSMLEAKEEGATYYRVALFSSLGEMYCATAISEQVRNILLPLV